MDQRLPEIDAVTDSFALPSREGALAACRDALNGRGPILVTGAAGVGKTWLIRRIMAGSPLRWVVIDAAPDMTAAELLATIAYRLGVPNLSGGSVSARLALAEALALSNADSRPAALVLDEAHLASDEVLEEIRLLSNRSLRRDGLTSIIVVGQTSLLRRIDSGHLAGLESRLAARVHLRPLDADEASAWLGCLDPAMSADRARVDHWHRETGGNPQRLRRLISRVAANPSDRPRSSSVTLPEPQAIPQAEPAHASEPLLPTKPPLLVEDGLIEVGWDSESESESSESPPTIESTIVPRQGEAVDDRYAALQAWDEWARNQGRVAAPTESEQDDAEPLEDDAFTDSLDPLDRSSGVWAESGQSFGPYSQLFSRLKPLKEAE